MTWNVLSLFAGIGGLELGLERAGMRTVGQVESTPFCRSVLARHWPDVPRHDDVRTARQWWQSEVRPVVDVVAGGYPCQPESTSGQRKGTADARWLWPEMARVIYTLKPRWVIGENVIGHRTQGLRFVLRDLERLGYTARAGTLRARDLGAPHGRARLFVVAYSTAAYAESVRRQERSRSGGRQHASLRGAPRYQPEHGATPAQASADPAGEGCRPWWVDASRSTAPRGQLADWAVTAGRAWWTDEPDVARMVHGLSDRVDRARALGNAVVPFCAEHIGRIVIDSDRQLRGCCDELVG